MTHLPFPMVGLWLGEHLWFCHICMTRSEAVAERCAGCDRGLRPPMVTREAAIHSPTRDNADPDGR